MRANVAERASGAIRAPEAAGDDDNVEWSEDVSEDAVMKRQAELVGGAAALTMNPDLDRTIEERLDIFHQFVQVRISFFFSSSSFFSFFFFFSFFLSFFLSFLFLIFLSFIWFNFEKEEKQEKGIIYHFWLKILFALYPSILWYNSRLFFFLLFFLLTKFLALLFLIFSFTICVL